MSDSLPYKSCPDRSCQVGIGLRHTMDCEIARCKEHGEQRLWCFEEGKTHTPSIFNGYHPGELEAVTQGWFYNLEDSKVALADINKAIMNFKWNSQTELFDLRRSPEEIAALSEHEE